MALTSTPIEPKAPHAECWSCPLFDKPCAKSIIPKNPIAAVVARSPGYMEAKMGKPFSGKSGDVLKHLLKEQGVDVNEVLLTNVVLCAPDEGKVPGEAIKACAPRLQAELDNANVDLVIACGSEAVNLLVGRGAIDRYRGHRIERNERVFIASNNPALVLRDDSTFPNLRKDFKRAFNPTPDPPLPIVEVIEDVDTAISFIKSIKPGLVAADIESRGGLTHRANIVCMQFATGPGTATVIGERNNIYEDRKFIDDCLRPFFESLDYQFIWHNGKFDTKIFRATYGIQARVDEDTMLMSYACDERSGQTEKWHGGYHKLEYLLSEEFGWPDYEPESVKDFKKTGIASNYEELYEYAGRDAAGTYQLHTLLSERIESEGVESYYRSVLLEGSEACTRIELTGFRYDHRESLDVMEFEVNPELHKLTNSLRKLLDNPIYNPRSPQQNAVLFYDDWKISHDMQNRPDKARSVDVSALNEIIAGRFTNRAGFEEGTQDHWNIVNFAIELRKFRQLSKQADTYLLPLAERAMNDPDSKVYTDILLHSTTSGRTSSRNPNLQNITRTKPGFPDIRRLFLATKGRKIVQADYSQAELRCIAWLSQDQELLRIYEEDLDLHSEAAARFYGEGFTSENRSRAKNMNFGVAYGQTAATFQEKHEIPESEAEKFIQWWWTFFTGVKRWKQDITAEMRTGAVVSPYGNKRRFHLLTRENLNSSIREAVNFKPQATGGILTLRSVIVLLNEIDPKQAEVTITVHDNIVANVKESYIDEYKQICEQVMITRPKDELGWTIPFKVDIGVGPSWGEAK